MAALGANLGIAVTKLVAFLITGSASLLAETVHSVADSCNEVLLLVGRRRSGRQETQQHPFGFGQERYFYGFIVAVMLFAVGGVYSVYDGIKKIIHPEQLTSPAVAFAVLGVAIVLESFSLRTAVSRSNDVRGQLSWGAFIRRAKAPELPVVLLEDTAALAGLVFALIGVTLAVVTGNGAWDGAGSLAIGALLCCVAVVLAVEMKSLLIGESANAEAEARDRGRAGGRARGRVRHPPAHRAYRAGVAAGGRQDRGSRRADRGRDRGGASIPPNAGCARSCP